jgi:hypothetical protein
MRLYGTIALLVALLSIAVVSLQARKGYRHRGPVLLNSLTQSPGAIRSADAQDVCTTRTSTIRRVTQAQKKQVCADYGVPSNRCTGKFVEIDHLISLELGGSNDTKNLWPQPYKPTPGAKEKDQIENWLHRQVCSGQMSLRDARKAIATDWFAVWKKWMTSPHQRWVSLLTN